MVAQSHQTNTLIKSSHNNTNCIIVSVSQLLHVATAIGLLSKKRTIFKNLFSDTHVVSHGSHQLGFFLLLQIITLKAHIACNTLPAKGTADACKDIKNN